LVQGWFGLVRALRRAQESLALGGLHLSDVHLHLSDVHVEETDRVALEALSLRLVPLNVL